MTKGSCSECRGVGITVIDGMSVSCPRCSGSGAMAGYASDWKIIWDSKTRAYEVNMVGPYNKIPKKVRNGLPSFIASCSTCECGNTLQVKNHSMEKSGEDLIFSGIFICPSCNSLSDKSMFLFRRNINDLWSKITKLKVGISGIEIEKK